MNDLINTPEVTTDIFSNNTIDNEPRLKKLLSICKDKGGPSALNPDIMNIVYDFHKYERVRGEARHMYWKLMHSLRALDHHAYDYLFDEEKCQ